MVKRTKFIPETQSDRFNTYQSAKKEIRGFSAVGSPDYMAPEMLTNSESGYDLSVDYWSLGCILFETLCGYQPFASNSVNKVWINLYNWKKVLSRPNYEGEDSVFNLSDSAWDMITK